MEQLEQSTPVMGSGGVVSSCKHASMQSMSSSPHPAAHTSVSLVQRGRSSGGSGSSTATHASPELDEASEDSPLELLSDPLLEVTLLPPPSELPATLAELVDPVELVLSFGSAEDPPRQPATRPKASTQRTFNSRSCDTSKG